MNQIDIKQEIDRRKSTTARLLEAFKLKGELTTGDIRQYGTGCSSRLFELRKEGHVIVANYIKPGYYVYVYKGQKNSTELPDNWDDIKSQASEGDNSRLAVID